MGDNERPNSQGILGFLFDELRSAMQDIRQKVVEEGWFGRVVSPAPVVEMDRSLGRERGGLYSDDHRPALTVGAATPKRAPSFEELWKPREPGEQPADIGKDRGIDLSR